MADRYVSRDEIAARLGLSVRQITNLVKYGKLADGTPFPSRVEGKHRVFPSDRCFDWYIQFKQEEALQRAAPRPTASLADAELRKAIADADVAELRLQKLRGEVVPIDSYRRELRRVCDRLRARIMAMPGEHGAQLGLATTAEGVTKLRAIAIALLEEMQSAGADTEPEDDGGDDTPMEEVA